MRFYLSCLSLFVAAEAVASASPVENAVKWIENAEALVAKDRRSFPLVGSARRASHQHAAHHHRRALGWTALGCYTDSVQARGLPYGAGIPGGPGSMTVEACQTACKAAGYTYAGVEYSQECYCGNDLENDSGPAPDGNAKCNMKCLGNAGETCGGPERMNMYSYGVLGASATSTTSTTKSTTSSPPAATSSSAAWTPVGCYTDNVSARSLGVTMGTPGGQGALTIQACTAACKAAGYTLAGVEYSGECYCDNQLRNSGGPAPDGNTLCNMPCNGNNAQICGGPNRLSLFTLGNNPPTAPSTTKTTSAAPTTTAWTPMGCFGDDTNQRSLSQRVAVAGGLSIEACQAACKAAGYPIAGVEYSQECYCDSVIRNGGATATDGNAQCTMTCNGNPSQTCGGPNRLNMYKYGTMAVTVMPSPTPTWSAQGCYYDYINARILSNRVAVPGGDGAVTIEVCQAACRQAGYVLAGVEYGQECYCDSMLRNGAAPASDGNAGCNMACRGNGGEICGGPNRVNLFKLGTAPMQSAPIPPPPTQNVPSGSRAIFAHYMVGWMTQAQANADVQQAKAMGFDGFALNVHTATDQWCLTSLSFLFGAAQGAGFKLFFSFDMSWFTDPSQFVSLLQTYHNHPAHFLKNNLPLVSTYGGGADSFGYGSPNAGWQARYRNLLSGMGISTFFVPSFDDSGVAPGNIFNSFPVVDGIFAWETAWPYASSGRATVDSNTDQVYLSAARAAGKTYMMGMSPLQFKHLDSYNNFFRVGGLSLVARVQQILTLAPDFVEIVSWNDAGESHYIGPIYAESIAGTNIGTYSNGYDHTGWQILLQPVTNAYKTGITSTSNIYPSGGAQVSGLFWHATLLTSASCAGDPLGKPSGIGNSLDAVEVAVIVGAGVWGLKVNVYSGGMIIGSFAASPGLNAWEVTGMRLGQQRVEVVNGGGQVLISGTGGMAVVSDSRNCNYNPQVVGLG